MTTMFGTKLRISEPGPGRAWLFALAMVLILGLALAGSPAGFAQQAGGAAGVRAIADGEPPSSMQGVALARFFQQRGNAAGVLGRIQQSIEDLRQALALAQRNNGPVATIARDLGFAENRAGNIGGALKAARVRVDSERDLPPGRRISGMAQLARAELGMGRLPRAENLIEDMRAIYRRLPARVPPPRRSMANHQILDADARVLAARGKHEDAEKIIVEAISELTSAAAFLGRTPQARVLLDGRLTSLQITRTRMLMTLGREVEAEAQMRDAMRRNIRDYGKLTPTSANVIDFLGRTVFVQGRFDEAVALGRESEAILRQLGARETSVNLLRVRIGLARALAGQGEWEAAAEIVRDVDRLTAGKEQLRRRSIAATVDSALIYYEVGEFDAGLRIANDLAQRSLRRLGEKHFNAAMARGIVAIGLYHKGEHERALADFRKALPILLSRSRDVEGEETSATARSIRLRAVLEGYMGVLAHIYGNVPSPEERAAIAAEAFRISDAARGSSVQRAVAQSSARAAARDAQLAKLVRQEQDLLRQIAALFGLLTALQSAPEGQSDASATRDLRENIDALRGERAEVREDLEDRFPDYIRLIDPPPSELADVRNALADDESIFVTYVDDDRTYVWAFGKSGDVGFKVAGIGRVRLGAAATQLRRALDPQASTLADIPDFDTRLAHRIYQSLLAPVADGWNETPNLIVVADGPLGQIPFALLPTATAAAGADNAQLFDRYRDVPWLARTHSVMVMPSVASLVALRSLSGTGQADRAFLGFGDPVFNDAQRSQTPLPGAQGDLISRGGLQLRNVPVRLRSLPRTQEVDAAQFSQLPRLPDTADEIRTMASALDADPARDVFIGKQANEQSVRAAPLDAYRVVAFATHGLVPGDLDGLVEPALALTAPHIAGDQNGDGLLQMGEIFELEMNADWVVLSACNTGTAAGAGAEAVSGLGRAFFYAGTRALLVSNWPVETTSARLLTTDIFTRQTQQPGLTRAEALRQAQIALIDGPGFVDPETGKPAFSYAHPIFWAPFSLIGEGGDY
ncbi:MAG: CHAT domain-containing tetratricopeptide repeat protein, partial [Alphaproteobacteria bacterium]